MSKKYISVWTFLIVGCCIITYYVADTVTAKIVGAVVPGLCAWAVMKEV